MLGILLAAQLAIVAHAPDTVAACEPIELSVAVSVPAGARPQLLAPSLAAFEVLRASAAPQMARDSRAVPALIAEYRYVLAAEHPGVYTIPAFTAQVAGASVSSRPMRIVVEPAASAGEPQVVTRARIDTGQDYSLHRTSVPDTVFVGQQADYEVAVFLNAAVRARMRRNPTFFPPDMQSMLAYDFAPSAGAGRGLGTRCFDALVYRRALFPLQAGRLAIPPAQLSYAISLGASFFSREESHDIQTDSAIIVAVDPPLAGRPAGYDGAVGRLQLSARMDASAPRVGDPLTLSVRVSGEGNVKLFPRPALRVPWASVVASDERVQVDSTGRRIRGYKEFDWIVTPQSSGAQQFPVVRYPYFDPEVKRYDIATVQPAPLVVAAGSLAAVDTSARENALPLRPTYRGALDAPLPFHPAFWLLLALAPLPAIGARWRTRNRRPQAVSPDARIREALRAEGPAPGGRALRRAFVAALTDRLALDADAVTRPGALLRALRRAGVTTGTAAEAEALLRELDAAAFGAAGALAGDAAARATDLVRRVDREALGRGELPLRVIALVLVAALGVGVVAQALEQDPAAEAFRNGVSAYEHHDYAAARAAFAYVVTIQPRAADGWANLGTSAWAASDTAHAVYGWRRALGMEPLASDARERLALVHGIRVASPGYVPPVPLSLAALLLGVCWIAACALVHPGVQQRVRGAGRWAASLVAASALVGLLMIAVGLRLNGHQVAVARANAVLSDDPALGADHGPTVVSGEMLRVLGREGAWSRVALDGGREGWLPSDGLLRLDEPLPSLD